MSVNTSLATFAPATPAALRAYLARHSVARADVARRYGCSAEYVSAVVNSDRNTKPVSAGVLARIRDIAVQIVWEREVHD